MTQPFFHIEVGVNFCHFNSLRYALAGVNFCSPLIFPIRSYSIRARVQHFPSIFPLRVHPRKRNMLEWVAKKKRTLLLTSRHAWAPRRLHSAADARGNSPNWLFWIQDALFTEHEGFMLQFSNIQHSFWLGARECRKISSEWWTTPRASGPVATGARASGPAPAGAVKGKEPRITPAQTQPLSMIENDISMYFSKTARKSKRNTRYASTFFIFLYWTTCASLSDDIV